MTRRMAAITQGAIREVHARENSYWIKNVMMVKRSNGRFRRNSSGQGLLIDFM